MRTESIQERTKIDEIIKACKTCYMAMAANDVPYVLPMNFALENEVVILHSAQSGRMWETLQKNPKVCINWTLGEELAWQNEKVGCSYRVKSKSAIVEGTAEMVDDMDEKERCLHLLMAQYSNLEFKFNPPAVKNVGIIKVHIEKISARNFGAKVIR
jgi:uncharacterized protein